MHNHGMTEGDIHDIHDIHDMTYIHDVRVAIPVHSTSLQVQRKVLR